MIPPKTTFFNQKICFILRLPTFARKLGTYLKRTSPDQWKMLSFTVPFNLIDIFAMYIALPYHQHRAAKFMICAH